METSNPDGYRPSLAPSIVHECRTMSTSTDPNIRAHIAHTSAALCSLVRGLTWKSSDKYRLLCIAPPVIPRSWYRSLCTRSSPPHPHRGYGSILIVDDFGRVQPNDFFSKLGHTSSKRVNNRLFTCGGESIWPWLAASTRRSLIHLDPMGDVYWSS